jgi:hypothetical protein
MEKNFPFRSHRNAIHQILNSVELEKLINDITKRKIPVVNP